MLNSSLFSSKDQTWETPLDLFCKLNNAFKFDLDVCALDETAKCDKYFTPETDGLKQSWSIKDNEEEIMCWMNPPYGREQIKWMKKANDESNANGNLSVVCLVPARPDTKMWHDIIFKHAKAICFIKGRLKFGGRKESAPFPSALVVLGNTLTEEQESTLHSLGKLYINN